MALLPLIVEADELQQQLDNPNIVIVDLCAEQTFARGHIPHAVHVSPGEIIAGTPPAPGKLPSKDRLDQLFSRLGLRPDQQVVAYDDEGGGWAGRFIWTLDVIGHKNYSYLNGGLWAWRGAGLPLSTDITTPEKHLVSVVISEKPTANLDEIVSNIQSQDFIVWDARGADEYAGEKHTAVKAGHIPGAINIDWLELMDRASDLRIRSDVKALLAQRGIHGDKPIVTHCHTHHRSGLSYLVGKMLGFTIRAYPGSWSEYGNHPTTPVER